MVLLLLISTVNAKAPGADFTTNTLSGPEPLRVSFTDLSSNDPTGWAWFFGDETYSSPWMLMNSSPGWIPRMSTGTVATPSGVIVMTGGDANDGFKNDVWVSQDKGATWTQATPGAEWTPRDRHSVVAMPDGSIVLMGGGDLYGNKNDTWRSTDNGTTWIRMTEHAGWSERGGQCSVAMPDGRIVLMGGINFVGTNNPSYYHDVWSSADNGATWTLMNATAGWSGRAWFGCEAMPDESIVLTGGDTNEGDTNDSWRSTDYGKTWTQITQKAGWSLRFAYTTAAMPDGSIVLMGGNDNRGHLLNDTWRTTDKGATWSKVSQSAGWPGRFYHNSVALPDGSIVLLGGNARADVCCIFDNDVWRLMPVGSSARNPSHTYAKAGIYPVTLQAFNADGYSSHTNNGYITVNPINPVASSGTTAPVPTVSTTIIETSNVPPDLSQFSPPFISSLAGNSAGGTLHFDDRAYTSPWTEMNASPGWMPRLWHSAVAMPDGSIVLMGGQASGTGNDVWRSQDQGATWVEVTPRAGWSQRVGHSSVAMPDGSIVLMGGQSGGTYLNDVWKSTDNGATWTLINANPGWSPRWEHNSVVMKDGSIVLTGGATDSFGGTANDVWRSTDDGATWSRMTADAGWSPRSYQSAVALPDGSVEVMGGYESGIDRGAVYHNDVWRSTDNGATWNEITPSAGWTARWGQTVVALPDDSVMLMGGYDTSGSKKNDTWRSTDNGASWTLVNESSGWSPRVFYSSVVMPDGSIVLMGGDSGLEGVKNDVWRIQPSGILWKLLRKPQNQALPAVSGKEGVGQTLPENSTYPIVLPDETVPFRHGGNVTLVVNLQNPREGYFTPPVSPKENLSSSAEPSPDATNQSSKTDTSSQESGKKVLFIYIDPIRDFPTDSSFNITGSTKLNISVTTNFPAGSLFWVDIINEDLSSSLLYNIVLPAENEGDDLNEFSYTHDMSGNRPGHYRVEIHKANTNFTGILHFNITSPEPWWWVSVDPVSQAKEGKELRVTGTTNLPAGTNMTVSSGLVFHSCPFRFNSEPVNTNGRRNLCFGNCSDSLAKNMVKVIPGLNGKNIWFSSINTTEWCEGETYWITAGVPGWTNETQGAASIRQG